MRRLILLLPLVIALCVTACSRGMTEENLNRVANGMSEAQVEAILGKPTRIESSEIPGAKGTAYLYMRAGAPVVIVFLNHAVMLKHGTFR